ncbi:HDIG domain-containing metalloprotein [Pseudanabaena sp. FACHB-2040]|uniref:HD family phosphohydrolase n=1 Tax=Pseudanabaena sp. FACHB-2040 TaxID=2692859 RepID=UPI001682D8A0|nr:HDIG domain-containing metalloprotein [Pseudanabaena sp. FACHB-2040]MBD2260147.1 HDIG domain-containing protein [Pseudanabaena sp. FACHB-2040]
MKALQDLISAVEQWRQLSFKASLSGSVPLTSARSPLPSTDSPSEGEQLPVEAGDPCRPLKRRSPIRRHPRLIYAVAVLSLTASLGQRFYNQPELQVGTAAPETVAAPRDASVVDATATEDRQRAARSGALRVLRIDVEANVRINRTLNSLLQQASMLRSQAGQFPFTSTEVLSTPVQRYVRRADEAEWVELSSLVLPAVSATSGEVSTPVLAQLEASERFQALPWVQRKTVREMLGYRQRTSQQKFLELQIQIAGARRQYQRAKDSLKKMASSEQSDVFLNPAALDLTASEWETTRLILHKATDRMTAQGIMPGLPPEILNRAVTVQLRGMVPTAAEEFAIQTLMSALQPNLIEDPEQTRLQAEMAADAVEPIMVSTQQGEVIVKAGEPISSSAFVLLDHFNLSKRRFNWLGFTGFGVLVGGSVLVFLVIERRFHPGLRQRDHLLITLLVLGAAGLSVAGVSPYSLPAIGLLAGSFYGAILGSSLVGLLTLLLPIGTQVSTIPLLASAAGGIVSSLVASRMRSREELALLGGGVGLTQGVVYLVLTLMFIPVSPSAWYSILTGAGMQGIYGIISSIVALGLSPYLEHLFDLVTPIRLAELANPNRPLLKRLASEAPGTFQHTVFVASLAEAAARSVGCNVELVRAGTLYHDIGKMHDPLGFIENQMGGPNKHDILNDPWRSAAIIKKHVTEGLVMARKHRLPKAVQSFIPEHQGTMVIGYFHHQAQEWAAKDPGLTVNEQDFRYDGPIPQSLETGIVMLADSCEAALRSMQEATTEEALALVNRILRARWKDNQLVDSGLTREQMTVIAEVFVQVWQQYNHKRIAYPKAALASSPAS